MSKTFTYEATVECEYNAIRDEYEFYSEEFDYEVDDCDLLDAVVGFIYEDYFMDTPLCANDKYELAVKKGLQEMIDNSDLDYWVDCYEDALRTFFEEDALEYYEEQL